MSHLKYLGIGLITTLVMAGLIWLLKQATIWFILWEYSSILFKTIFSIFGMWVVGGLVTSIYAGIPGKKRS